MQRSLAVTFDEQIEEVKREIATRKRVYPRWVMEQRITHETACKNLARMEAVLKTLQSLKDYRGAVPQPFFSLRTEEVDL